MYKKLTISLRILLVNKNQFDIQIIPLLGQIDWVKNGVFLKKRSNMQ